MLLHMYYHILKVAIHWPNLRCGCLFSQLMGTAEFSRTSIKMSPSDLYQKLDLVKFVWFVEFLTVKN